MFKSLLSFLTLLLLVSCQIIEEKELTKSRLEEYYKVYAAGANFDQFLSFYSEEVVLKDMINGDLIIGKGELREFFDWDHPDLKRDHEFTLAVESQIIEGNYAMTKGYFTPFSWGELSVEAMHFTTIHRFDSLGKISEQTDWINYPSSLVDYAARKNSNDWLNDSSFKILPP